MKTKIAIVIPNWNGKKYLTGCIDSLLSQSVKATIIVVDNGSLDGSVELLEKNYPNVDIVKLDRNYGFTGGVNHGIKRAKDLGAEYVALFNNDASADNNWLERLAETMQSNPSVGIVTGKLMRGNKKHIDSTGDYYTIWGAPYPRGRNQIDRGQFDTPGYIFGASAGASLYRMAMLDEIGLFDEDFFAYYEDVDISFRAQLANWRVYYQPLAVAYHLVGATSSKLGSFSRYHSTKNFILLYNRNMPGRLFWKYKPLFLIMLVRLMLGSIKNWQFLAFVKGFFKALIVFPKTRKVRKRNQKLIKVSIDQIDQLLVHSRPPKTPKF